MKRPPLLAAVLGCASAALVAGNWWLNRAWQPGYPPAPAASQRINYALSDFQGPAPRHRRNADPGYFRPPAGTRWTDPRGAYHGTAFRDRSGRSGLVGPRRIGFDRSRFAPTQAVRSGPHRPPAPARHHPNLHRGNALRHAAGKLHSPGLTHMEQAGTELTGGTLVAWIDDEIMELDQDVHAIYRVGDTTARD